MLSKQSSPSRQCTKTWRGAGEQFGAEAREHGGETMVAANAKFGHTLASMSSRTMPQERKLLCAVRRLPGEDSTLTSTIPSGSNGPARLGRTQYDRWRGQSKPSVRLRVCNKAVHRRQETLATRARLVGHFSITAVAPAFMIEADDSWTDCERQITQSSESGRITLGRE